MKHIATIGFFDGVHKGHQFLFEHLRAEAAQRGVAPLIITFDTHPRAVLQADYVPQLLTTVEERQALLSKYGEVVVLPFAEVQPLTAGQFMQRLHDTYEVTTLLMGYDHQFGSDRRTRPQDYRRIGAEHGIEVVSLPEYGRRMACVIHGDTGSLADGQYRVDHRAIRPSLFDHRHGGTRKRYRSHHWFSDSKHPAERSP